MPRFSVPATIYLDAKDESDADSYLESLCDLSIMGVEIDERRGIVVYPDEQEAEGDLRFGAFTLQDESDLNGTDEEIER